MRSQEIESWVNNFHKKAICCSLKGWRLALLINALSWSLAVFMTGIISTQILAFILALTVFFAVALFFLSFGYLLGRLLFPDRTRPGVLAEIGEALSDMQWFGFRHR